MGPALVCRVRVAEGGPASLRLSYLTEGLQWKARYAMTLEEGDRLASLKGFYTLSNDTDVPYRSARTRLIRSEQGALGPLFGPGAGGALRYSYGDGVPRFEQQLTGHAELQRYELPRRLNLDPAMHLSIPFVRSDEVGLERIYLYDGVRFDRFRRNRRNDWNYGTEYHTHVDAHLQFRNAASEGLGVELPAGRLNMFREDDQGGMDLLGSGSLTPSGPDDELRVRIGPARGLHGERVRTGYSEIVPLHEYDESFEIRLENHSGEDVEITVVEHMYRWPDYRIIKADAEYDETGPQRVEFRVPVKAGGERTVHYTVRYRW